LDLLRQDFVLEFKASGSDAVRDPARGLNTEFRPDLMEAYSREAGDPEMHIFAWLRHGAPLGLHTPIPASGIFPPNNQAGGPPEEFEALTARVAATYTSFRNYSSMLGENDGLACGKVQRLLDGGFLHEFSSFEELKEYVMGDPLLNKLGLLIKEKSDGTVKLRLITDLRASMGNLAWSLWEHGRVRICCFERELENMHVCFVVLAPRGSAARTVELNFMSS